MAQKTLEPHMWNLENMFKAIYNVPVYQRPYSWDKEQVEILLNDIQDAYESADKEDGYYTGNIIVYDRNEKINGLISKYDIIDGQQRITTFSLMLMELYALAAENGILQTDLTLNTIKSSLWKVINREHRKELCAVHLNSIEGKCFQDIFNEAFENPHSLNDYCQKYKCSSKFEARVVNNCYTIREYLEKTIVKDGSTAILDYADYILQYVQFVVIEANCKENKVFSMFESINSKGKRLEDIDLIKTFIFSKLDEESYSTYLDRWGQLIIATNDNLYDYLYNYIKAFMCFYRQNISVENFKILVTRDLMPYYGVSTEKEALKKLLDDMYDRVEFYNMLSSTESANKLVKNNKFRFFYKIFTDVSYKHPKALFLRTLIEYSEGKMKKEDVVDIFSETVGFMIKFLTISGRDSKDAITMFSGIMNEIYANNRVIKENVVNALATEYLRQGITIEKLKTDLENIDAYEQNKKMTIALLALYEASDVENNRFTISYDQAYMLLDSFSESFSLDHLLVQSPNSDSKQYKYYKNSVDDTLVLKEGNDFPKNIIVNGMDYDTFTHNILNKIGNLRIYYKDRNSARQNIAISLKEYPNFCSYADIVGRGKDVIDKVLNKCLPQPELDIIRLQKNNKKRIESSFPKMDKLIEYNLVKPGDKLYITVNAIKPEDSLATLVDDKYVLFQGEKLTLNNWGCKVTGWKSIRIYDNVAIQGEVETLHEKRVLYMKDHNESAI